MECHWAVEMIPWGKALAAKADHLSLIPVVYTVDSADPSTLSSDPHIRSIAYVFFSLHTQK